MYTSAQAERKVEENMHPEVEPIALVEMTFIFPTVDLQQGRLVSCVSNDQVGWACQQLDQRYPTQREIICEVINSSGQATKFSIRTPTDGESKPVIHALDPVKHVHVATDCPDFRIETVHFGRDSPLYNPNMVTQINLMAGVMEQSLHCTLLAGNQTAFMAFNLSEQDQNAFQ